jgi:response regulator RpfG family c-di-GMP phosphodiesterase
VSERAKILFVDDEVNVLNALQRQLRGSYDVLTATSGADALVILAHDGPFAVLVSDMRMPGMDGAQLLERALHEAPQTVRVLLTGQADLDAAMAAVNQGHVFRFLCKPCSQQSLQAALAACVEQHRLITAERDLLEKTLRGAVTALVETLALAHPLAFGRAMRLKNRVVELAEHCRVEERWPIEVAAMLSQLGSVSLPPRLLERWHRGEALRPDEQEQVERAQKLTETLLAHLPRLEPVREILRQQPQRFDGSGPGDGKAGEALAIGARLLRLCDDFDVLETRGRSPAEAVAALRSRAGVYDPALLDALEKLRVGGDAAIVVREVQLSQLRVGMQLVEDVYANNGLLLVTRGQEITIGLLTHLRNFERLGVKQPIVVRSSST